MKTVYTLGQLRGELLKATITNELIQDGIAMKEVFTLTQLTEAWESYKTDRVMKVLKEGRWYIRVIDSHALKEDGVTQAKVVSCIDAMGFPHYLEKYYG